MATATVSSGPAFLDEVCVPFLVGSQNADGGWGFHPGGQSAVEPSCGALQALNAGRGCASLGGEVRNGLEWLCKTQLTDGSWPAFADHPRGCWVTALACRALHAQKYSPEAVRKGLAAMCNAWPVDGSPWRLVLRRLFAKGSVVRQDSSLRGWSWTPGTASWTEPTAQSLITLRTIPAELHPEGAERRKKLGERMLYDRMCAGGGWNSGNPQVYGVAGEPRVSPTVWALLALYEYRNREENQASLGWLEREYDQIQGPASLALAHICLRAHGRATAQIEPALERLYWNNEFFRSTQAMALAAIALSGAENFARHADGKLES
jgi:hypothetical protein